MAALIAVSSAAIAAESPSPSYVQRLRWQAQLQTLNAELLSHDSATAVLQALCDRRDPAAPRIQARHVAVVDDPDRAAEVRRELNAAANARVKHRRVELTCGAIVLSRADNWYLPDRLTPEMDETLDTTDTPFGVVARPLKFQRRTLSARLLFEPLPVGWEVESPDRLAESVSPPAEVLQHRAVLQTPDGRPFSLLIETYSDRILLP